MSEQWKSLSRNARQPFLDRAAADKERYRHDKQQYAEAELREKTRRAKMHKKEGGSEGGRDRRRELSEEMLFPLARIRRVMKLDPEVKTISKEAAMLVAKATVTNSSLLPTLLPPSFFELSLLPFLAPSLPPQAFRANGI